MILDHYPTGYVWVVTDNEHVQTATDIPDLTVCATEDGARRLVADRVCVMLSCWLATGGDADAMLDETDVRCLVDRRGDAETRRFAAANIATALNQITESDRTITIARCFINV